MMRYCVSRDVPGAIYVDQGVDQQADPFYPCGDCFNNLQDAGSGWHPLSLCQDCCYWFDATNALAPDHDRPFIGDRPPEVIPWDRAYPPPETIR